MTQKELNALREKALFRGDLDTAERYRTQMEQQTIKAAARDAGAALVVIIAILVLVYGLPLLGGAQ